jgi:hypothetical protein
MHVADRGSNRGGVVLVVDSLLSHLDYAPPPIRNMQVLSS